MDWLAWLKLLRVVAPRLAATAVVIGCIWFPQQTTAVLINSAEKRAAQIVEILDAGLGVSQPSRPERPAH